jgi:N-acetylglucosamine-6-phosphate deacetylase
LIPAEFLGVEQSLGSITVGKRACLAIVDSDYNVQGTLIDGELVYGNKSLTESFNSVIGTMNK